MEVPWGRKAFSGYLGKDRDAWALHDACELIRRGPYPGRILIDQGRADQFLVEQLRPESFDRACRNVGQVLELRMHESYDHSYYFIQTFMGDHVAHHAGVLSGI